MPVTTMQKDGEARTITFVADFDADVERVWQVWQDARQLERWWGPPTWPATFEEHDFTVGGHSHYRMTGIAGEEMRGFWRITAIEAPNRLEFDDGFEGELAGEALVGLDPAHIVVTIDPHGTGSRMTVTTSYTTTKAFDQVVTMGVEEGMTSALKQIDVLLAENGH